MNHVICKNLDTCNEIGGIWSGGHMWIIMIAFPEFCLCVDKICFNELFINMFSHKTTSLMWVKES